ncbi:DUF742 domain-containing protein [Streptomyces purpurogeneiscleroticus]|uniref:DUF742 domain-containing protein n=1 Tax=Streptomyces purpurogeneiscleroticus TaxID=68259 RepID=UPI001CC00BFC|nr:DUF742 domain-containing protein [Streptomyces purpurogeneiscleroticus]MBZ4020067.1 hypothetical protein [Streptomyces purpurogeneiscleroticus]
MADFADDPWLAEDTAHLRLYALTGGRTRPARALGLVSRVRLAPGLVPGTLGTLGPESAQVVEVCSREPRSVAEIAARLGIPVNVTKILLSDLLDTHVLVPALPPREADGSDPLLLEAALEGLRSL